MYTRAFSLDFLWKEVIFLATIHDVARLAKVSKTTVSKVLSNTPYVSEETRQRVLDAMLQLHYSPNLAARGLKSHRTYVIGLIIPYDPQYLFHDPFVMDIILGVESAANAHDYSVLLAIPKPDDQHGVYDRFLRTGYVDGVVTLESYQGGINDQLLDALHLPRVSAGYREDLKPLNCVHSDDRLGAYLAVSHLLTLGHRRIGVISGPTNFVVAVEERMRGACEALSEWHLSLDPQLVSYGDFTLESGYRAAQTLLAQEPRPTAIFAMNDRMAVGALYYAHELGLSLPTDLSLVGFDDISPALVDPPLTTIRQFPERIGRTAAEQLVELIHKESTTFAPIILPVELIVRGTTVSPP